MRLVAGQGEYVGRELTLEESHSTGVHVSLIGLDEARIREIGEEASLEQYFSVDSFGPC